MHEYSLAMGLVEALREELRRHPVNGRIAKVHVRQGELLVLSEEALQEAWRILTQGGELAGSELAIEKVAVRVRCGGCGYQGPVGYLSEQGWHFAVPVLRCPRCGGRVEVVEGRDLAIVGLSLEEQGSPT